MDIHIKINRKGYEEYMNTNEIYVEDGIIKYRSRKGLKATFDGWYMMYSLWINGMLAQAKTIHGGKYVCNECDGCEHYRDDSIHVFRDKWRHYQNQLELINKDKY